MFFYSLYDSPAIDTLDIGGGSPDSDYDMTENAALLWAYTDEDAYDYEDD